MDMQSHYQPEGEDDPFLTEPSTSDNTHASGGSPETQPELIFPNLGVFVNDYLVHQYTRPVDPLGHEKDFTWCASWWAHTEAVSRLNALWRAWEALRLDEATGMADWWNTYADPTMRALFYNKGPFQGCTVNNHAPANKSLPTAPVPEGLFSLQ